MKNTMKINYYRYPSAQGEQESWQNCQFTHNTDLSPFTEVKPLVTLNGQPIIRQHHSTYLTGKDTCRAHHFAKYLAIQVLTGESVSTSPVPCAVTLSRPSLLTTKIKFNYHEHLQLPHPQSR